MSERIKDMMKEAAKTSLFEFASWEMTVSENGKEYNIPLEFCERFAELIIQECIRLGEDSQYKCRTFPVSVAIKDHFGVV